jgi:hypothetical protein
MRFDHLTERNDSERKVTRDAKESTEEQKSFAFAHRVLIATCIASPFRATVMLLIKMLYIEDVLGDPIMRAGAVY